MNFFPLNFVAGFSIILFYLSIFVGQLFRSCFVSVSSCCDWRKEVTWFISANHSCLWRKQNIELHVEWLLGWGFPTEPYLGGLGVDREGLGWTLLYQMLWHIVLGRCRLDLCMENNNKYVYKRGNLVAFLFSPFLFNLFLRYLYLFNSFTVFKLYI